MPDIRYSIIITCYNQARFIKDAVESALSQRYAAKEIIVVDDGSNDNSLSVLKQYEPAITLLALATNRGASVARNQGAAVATGAYLLFLDGDDLLTPWALDIYEQLITELGPTAIMSAARRFEGPVPVLGAESPKRLEFFEYPSLMAKDRGYGMNIGAFVIDRLAFHKVGGWSPEIFHLDGQDLYAKLAYSGSAIVVRSPYTMLYRMHAANSIRSVPPFLRSAHLIIKRERAGIYPGGRSKRFERYARHGGVVVFCVKKALRARLYADGLCLVVSGWSMILAAIIRRANVRLRGRRPMQTRELRPQESSCHETVAQNGG